MSWQAQSPIWRLLHLGSLQRLNKYEKIILLGLASNANLIGEASRAGRAALAMDFSISISYVQRAMNGLKEKLGHTGLLLWQGSVNRATTFEIDMIVAAEMIALREQHLLSKYPAPKKRMSLKKAIQQAVRRYRKDAMDAMSAERRREVRAEEAGLRKAVDGDMNQVAARLKALTW